MSDLARLAYEHQKNKLQTPTKPAFERITVAEMARRHEQFLKEQAMENKEVIMGKLQIPVSVLANGETLGKALGDVTNKLFSFGRSLSLYAKAAAKSYVDTVKKSVPVEVEDPNDPAVRMLKGESFTGVLPTGEQIVVEHGQIVSMRKVEA